MSPPFILLLLAVLFPAVACIGGSSSENAASSSQLQRQRQRQQRLPWSVAGMARGGSTSPSTSTNKPSWLQMDRDTLQEYMQLAKQRHAQAVKAAEESYYSSSSSSSSNDDSSDTKQQQEHLPQVQSFGISAPPTWSLPDFTNEFKLDKIIYVTSSPLFTSQECNQVIKDAEAYFEGTNNGTWTTLPSGQYDVAGFWIRDIPAVHEWFNNAVKTKLFPLLQRQFPEFVSIHDLVVDNAYLFKYTTTTGRRTDVHTDSGCLSFTIALNEKSDYSGGGTWFESLSSENNTIEMDQGMVTVRPGGVRHCGQAVTSGTRYIIGGFCMHKSKVEHTRMLIGLGAERASQGDLQGAQEAYIASISINPKFDAAYPNLASVLEQQGKTQQAKEVLEYCHLHVNGQNAEVAYSLGVLYLNEGEYEKCKSCMKVCLESDDCDVESLMVMAQACAGQGDAAGEEAWYRRVTTTPGVTDDKAASAYCNLGVLKEGSDEEIQLYEKGLALAPNHFQLRYSLGSALAGQEDYEEAAKHFRVAVESSNDNPELQMKALQVLYRAAITAAQSDKANPAKTREEVMERLYGIMGKSNYELLAASASKGQ